MGYGGFGSMGDFGGLGMVFGLLVVVALIGLFVWGMSTRFSPQSRTEGAARPSRTSAATTTGPQFSPQSRAEDATPLEIVQRRHARGEISEAEYERARKALA